MNLLVKMWITHQHYAHEWGHENLSSCQISNGGTLYGRGAEREMNEFCWTEGVGTIMPGPMLASKVGMKIYVYKIDAYYNTWWRGLWDICWMVTRWYHVTELWCFLGARCGAVSMMLWDGVRTVLSWWQIADASWKRFSLPLGGELL